ncbi:MAG: transposase [Fimbriimonadaceae bacterium]
MGTRKDFLEVGVIRKVTFSTFQKAHLLRDPRCSQAVIEALAQAKSKLGFELYAYVAMSNHVHFAFRLVHEPLPLSRVLSAVKTSSGKRILGILREFHPERLADISFVSPEGIRQRVWMPGGGFDRSLRDTDAVWNSIAYIHNNPVKAGLVHSPEEYEFSSARAVHLGDYSVLDPLPRIFRT